MQQAKRPPFQEIYLFVSHTYECVSKYSQIYNANHIYVYIYIYTYICLCLISKSYQTEKKRTLAVRETGVSEHNESPIKDPP